MENDVKKIQCISLCEVLRDFIQGEVFDEKLYNDACMYAGYNSVERIYVGSNFCSQYFLTCSSQFYEPVFAYCEKKKIPVTLCVPVISEKDLTAVKKIIHKLIEQHRGIIDEVTVNDYAMVNEVANRYTDIKINLGRLFQKDTRDIRYLNYFMEEYTPMMLTLGTNLFVPNNINSMEFDPTHSKINLSGIKCIPAVYSPYCFATVGNICEYASLDKPLSKKFRANINCDAPCSYNCTIYNVGNNLVYLKLGRTVYYKNLNPTIVGVQQYREIFEPFDVFCNKENMHE